MLGKEFDADERAEVGGSDGRVEGKLPDAAFDVGSTMNGRAEQGRVNDRPVRNE
jgi:hypothetical protein